MKNSKKAFADKGYASSANQGLLKENNIKSGIMGKAKVNKPLTAAQKRFNRLISKIRYKIEQGFGTLKRRFQFICASYFTTVKVHAQMTFKAMAFNLLKGLNKINLTHFQQDNCVRFRRKGALSPDNRTRRQKPAHQTDHLSTLNLPQNTNSSLPTKTLDLRNSLILF